MQCPQCARRTTRVVDSRLAADGTQVRRRRACGGCGARFTTFETAELVLPRIVKRDGTPEPFDETKLRRGMTQALYKRPVATEAVDAAIGRLQQRLQGDVDRDVPADRLGEWVMAELRDLDQVAYVRFASIYRRFQDVNAFREEIAQLEATSTPTPGQLSLIDNPATDDDDTETDGDANTQS
ncbi:transcriptional repressor NrdR [Salinisphaera sp. USBA-960]|uniref:transcriptional regulator NrdR n=1 Tax=Salinisphaera orenii TaxID=856731 RepID=UPI000DBEA44E|nr:transcriptional repressor NrdR [Salifodinibacter halophilus]NNC25324.1 transcriptional repressor NrdR [Salifodinibacter halophilus]